MGVMVMSPVSLMHVERAGSMQNACMLQGGGESIFGQHLASKASWYSCVPASCAKMVRPKWCVHVRPSELKSSLVAALIVQVFAIHVTWSGHCMTVGPLLCPSPHFLWGCRDCRED